MNALRQIARSLPQAEKVHISLSTYIAVVKEALYHGDCELCCVCGEPLWNHCRGNHRCFDVSIYYDANIAEALAKE